MRHALVGWDKNKLREMGEGWVDQQEERQDRCGGGIHGPAQVRQLKWWLLAAIVLVVLFGVGFATRFFRGKVPAAEVGVDAVPVEVVAVAQGDVEQVVRLTGRVVPQLEVNVFSKIPGRIQAVYVDVGDRVRPGQILVKLDDAEIAAQVRQAEAGLAVVRASEAQARLDVERAAVALEQAGISFGLAEDNFDRGKFLLEQGALSQADFEARFQTPYVNAEAGLKQAQISYEMAQDRLEHVVPAQELQMQAALEAARLQLASAVISASLNGFVAARFADPGEMASPAQPLLTVVDFDEVQVETSVAETEINKIKLGQEVPVTVTAAGAKHFTGEITSIAPAADARSKMYSLKIALPNPGHHLKPGMFAEVNLAVESRQKVLKVPVAAVLKREGRAVVYVAERGRACMREVETGLSDGRYVEVRKGLQEGELVVVTGQEFLAEGISVVVREDRASEKQSLIGQPSEKRQARLKYRLPGRGVVS